MSGIVQLEGVNKYFGKNHVVKNLNLSVEEGEFLTLLGSSGCGKTTTLRMIAGFEEPTSGSILVEGQAVEEKEPFERNVNTVFQSYALFPHKTIYDNVAYGLKMKKVPKTEIARRVKEIMALVQLSGFEERYPSQLSGGQKQRVAIARALINRPRVLLLDEPLGALDLKLRKQMQLELKRLQRKLNITFIYVTHDQEEALTMSDRSAVMHDGILDQLGTPEEIYEQPRTKFVATFIGETTPEEIYEQPRTKFVATFIGETNIFEGNIKELAMGRVAVRIENGVIRGCGYGFSRNEYITVSVRPEKMRFSTIPVKGFQLEAQVKDYVYAGSVVKCIAVLQNGMEIKMDRLAGEELPEPGSIIHPWWEEKDAVLLHNPENQVLKMIDSMPLI